MEEDKVRKRSWEEAENEVEDASGLSLEDFMIKASQTMERPEEGHLVSETVQFESWSRPPAVTTDATERLLVTEIQ